ncbi:hypothetical protein JCM15415_12200 [Methanobacterium movens]
MDTKHNLILDINELEFADFPIDELFSLQINIKNVKFEFLIRFSSNNNGLICMGSGEYNPQKQSPPIYNRHSWQGEFEESIIYYNDPTLYLNSELTLGWCVGKDEEWYLLTISEIICTLARINNIDSSNILFYGSSGGGFTSIILATLIKNSKAIVNNAQLFLENYWEVHFNRMIKTCFSDSDLETIFSLYKYRLDVFENFKAQKHIPQITYLVNADSNFDLSNQLIPTINKLNSFDLFDSSLKIILYSNKNGHNGVLDKKETIKLIKKHLKRDD